ncbi:MAG: helix-turn-helix transcriptional regulator [Ruminococcaceae bacterium]|nr:helix-turn-helix transcriptional regulator [Oscillospiraceae bacterium]MBQ8325120.1 helix-turn-helix transcriptional regulator [Clostridia bacterium]
MSREQRLRNLILDRYQSLRRFAIEADIPYSTLMTLLSRDLGGASFDVVMKICRALGIDPMELYCNFEQ